jgi:hypothetical protein
MTAFDFDRFRKYVSGDVPVPTPWKPPVGEGWHAMIFDALQKIDALVGGDASKFKIGQIKEKFGSLRFYCFVDDESAADEVFAIAEEIEARSATMCESCGAPAQIHGYGGWYACLCPHHAMIEIERREMKIGATGWRLGRIDERPAIIDKATGREIGDEKFREIEARVEATAKALEAEEGARKLGQKSAVGSVARSETAYWRHAKYVSGR